MIRESMDSFRVIGVCLFCLAYISGAAWAQATDPADKTPVAIKGYDPVAYFSMGRPMLGKPDLWHEVDDVRYNFASVEHLAQFREEPDRYLPRFGGLCAMGLGAKGYKVEANPENWAIHDGRLYLTQREFGPPIFKKSPNKWASAAVTHLQELKEAPVGTGISWW